MSLYRDILIEVLSRQEAKVTFENLKTENADEIVEGVCRKALRKIKNVIEDDELDDFECVERIVRVFEEIGSDGGSRHDFD